MMGKNNDPVTATAGLKGDTKFHFWVCNVRNLQKRAIHRNITTYIKKIIIIFCQIKCVMYTSACVLNLTIGL